MARARSLSEFQSAFPDEASCAAFLFERRWPDGFVCPACGNARAAALRSRAYTYECYGCGRQTSITAGTAMHRTRLPLTAWFWAAHLMATHSNGMSARQLEDMGVKAVSYPRMLTSAAIQGMKNALSVFQQSIEEGRVIDRPDLLVPFDELNDLMGLPKLKELEQRFVASRR